MNGEETSVVSRVDWTQWVDVGENGKEKRRVGIRAWDNEREQHEI